MALLNSYKKTEVKIEKVKKIKTQFDYSEFSETEVDSLIELEERALHTGSLLSDNLKELAGIFTEAQKIFSNNKNGNFGKWYEALGFKKDFVYLCLDRKNLAIKYEENRVYSLPERAIKDIKKLDKLNEVEVVHEILEAEKPTEKLKEIKELAKKKVEKTEVKTSMHLNYEQERFAKQELLDKFYRVEQLIGKCEIKDRKSKVIDLLEQIEKLLRG